MDSPVLSPLILAGDCREVLKSLPAESVQCCVTSPPYWGLRSYIADGDPRKPLEIGLEPTPEAHIAVLLEVLREVRRVLRKDGTLWMNYGDCYACAPNGRKAADIERDDRCFRDKPFSTVTTNAGHRAEGNRQNDDFRSARYAGQKMVPAPIGLKPKDLVGMPWRLALALQADGWWLRCDIVWSKLNPMPESVSDRPTRAHEYVFLLAKSERYFYDADAIRERTGNEMSAEEYAARTAPGGTWPSGGLTRYAGTHKKDGGKSHPAGRNKRSVWELATQPTPEAHFATFPEALVRPCILAGSAEKGCCPACGAPWAREREVVGSVKAQNGPGTAKKIEIAQGRHGRTSSLYTGRIPVTETTGWAPTCRCPHEEADCLPCVVLDPFGGSGTVGKVATALGRRSILIELNPAYAAMASEKNAQAGMDLR